ncbi:MAG: SRPBCC family protein [Rhizobacter sp.]|nr:SRPBCC family protein [Rhizobacter sp.]
MNAGLRAATRGGAASPARREYLSHWQLDAPPDAVWSALARVEDWPSWWRFVRSVRTLRDGQRGGDAEGLGAIRRIDWSSRLPYGFTLDVEVVESQRPHRLCGHASGGLEGTGLWQLQPDGGTTHVHYSWRLALNTRWMRVAAPIMSPLFRWNHEGVMHAGALGLARKLRVRLLRG